MLKKCEFIVGIHLNDNNITQDTDLYYDCLTAFEITEEDIIEINRSKRTVHKIHPSFPKKYDVLSINYKEYLKEYFDFENFMKSHGD